MQKPVLHSGVFRGTWLAFNPQPRPWSFCSPSMSPKQNRDLCTICSLRNTSALVPSPLFSATPAVPRESPAQRNGKESCLPKCRALGRRAAC